MSHSIGLLAASPSSRFYEHYALVLICRSPDEILQLLFLFSVSTGPNATAQQHNNNGQ